MASSSLVVHAMAIKKPPHAIEIEGEDFFGHCSKKQLANRFKMVNCRPQRPYKAQPVMKNINEGKGVFAPVVVIVRNIVGQKRFNQIRGKAIALHSQVITEFCKTIGADSKQRQGLIRLAKLNDPKKLWSSLHYHYVKSASNLFYVKWFLQYSKQDINY